MVGVQTDKIQNHEGGTQPNYDLPLAENELHEYVKGTWQLTSAPNLPLEHCSKRMW